MTQSPKRKEMDKIKVLLIGSIIFIAYYLLMQWPPNLIEESDNNLLALSETKDLNEANKTTIPKENILYSDRKDLLTPFTSSTGIEEKDIGNPSGAIVSSKIFYLENDVLKIGIEAYSGKFVSSTMKTIKVSKGDKNSLSILGNRRLSGEEGCLVNEGALKVGEECFGNYYANSGFFSQSGYIYPNYKFIEKTSLGDGKSLYTLSGESGEFYFVRRLLINENEYSVSVEDIVGLQKDSIGLKKLVPYVEIVRDGLSPSISSSRFESYTYTGPVFSTEKDTYSKLDLSDISKSAFQEDSVGGWFAFIQRYFVSAWVPDPEGAYKYQARKVSANNYSLALTGGGKEVSLSSPLSFKNKLYLGPKITEELNKLNPDLGLVADYGFLWFLAQPMYWLLGLGFKLLGNWGFAILFTTIVIRAVLWPLTAASYKSMAKMRLVAPKLQALQSKHGTDKGKLAQETMDLYKKEGVNPLGGCLPMILQMPFFIAFYWVLLDMVQLRHAPFIFWIDDLSSKDPYYFLPVLNGALMYFSQKFMPATPSADPTQQQMQQMMKYMPVGICIIFAWFPSGFVLYFTAQTLVQLIQQAINFRKEGVAVSSVLFK